MPALVPSPVQFICPGAQKAATRTLNSVLAQHPGVYLPEKREIHFFSDDFLYAKGPEYYRDHFYGDVPPGAVAGDITPNYLYNPLAVGRIVETLGTDLRIVILLRDPVNRAYSHYWMRRGKAMEDRPFAEVAREQMDAIRRLGGDHESLYAKDAYLHRGLYTDQVRRYIGAFGAERVQCILFEDFTSDQDAEVERILEHIGVGTTADLETGVWRNPAAVSEPSLVRRALRNPGLRTVARAVVPGPKGRHRVSRALRTFADKIEWGRRKPIEKPPLDEGLREELNAFFAPDIARLADLTGLATDRWTS